MRWRQLGPVPEENWLQVYFENKCVGWVKSIDASSVEGRMISFETVEDDVAYEQVFTLKKRSYAIDEEKLQRFGMKYPASRGVPVHYAEAYEDPMRHRLIYSWKAIECEDLANYERLFDMDEFEPADDNPFGEDPVQKVLGRGGLTTALSWKAGFGLLSY